MKQVMTICFLVKETNGKKLVCLAEKKRGFRMGKLNGYGGKLEEGESPDECVLRETFEESGLRLVEYQNRGVVRFCALEKTHECHIYVATCWSGDLIETEEMLPDWYPVSELPLEKMGEADPLWIPQVLEGKSVEATFYYDAQDRMCKKVIRVVSA